MSNGIANSQAIDAMVASGMSEERQQPWKALFVACCAVTFLAAACLLTSSAFDPQAIALMSEERKLDFDNAMAAHAVSQFSTAGQEGIQDPGSFHLESDGIQTALAKSKDEHAKFQVLEFRKDRDHLLRQNEKSEGYLNKVVALENAREKRHTEDLLKRWTDHRAALDRNVKFMRRQNHILNPFADHEGEKLAEQNKRAAKFAKHVLSDYEDQQAKAFKQQLNEFQSNQATLAAEIVGQKDTAAPSQDELHLLKQNELAAKCISSGDYRTGC